MSATNYKWRRFKLTPKCQGGRTGRGIGMRARGGCSAWTEGRLEYWILDDHSTDGAVDNEATTNVERGDDLGRARAVAGATGRATRRGDVRRVARLRLPRQRQQTPRGRREGGSRHQPKPTSPSLLPWEIFCGSVVQGNITIAAQT